MNKTITAIACLILSAASACAKADFSIVLYQPDTVISERVGGGVKEVAAYIDVVKQAWAETIPSESERKKTAIIVGLGYERQVTAWIMNASSNMDAVITANLRKHKAPWIRESCFVFALVGSDFKHPTSGKFTPPMPATWCEFAKTQSGPSSVDDILDAILPKKTSSEVDMPDGFVMQLLEPLGGKILRPKAWHYSENHAGPRYSWTISRESNPDGSYETGMKIQLFAGIEKGTGKSPKEFCESFLQSKAASTKVINRCPETKQGIFTRKGIEVEEQIGSKTYHIIYSVFWMKSSIAVVTISGAPAELWDKYKETFKIMSGFELIDMARFENKSESAN